MDKFLKTKLNLEKKKRRKNDIMLKIFVVIAVIGYAFFFSSKAIFPKLYRYSDIVDFGITKNADKFFVTVDTWEYSKKDKEFQIFAEIENFTLNDNTARFTVRNGSKIFKTKVYKVVKPNLYVIRVSGVPRKWTEAKLTITIGDEITSVNVNDKVVKNVDSLTDVEDKKMLKYARKEQALGIKEYIKKLDEKIKDYDKQQVKAYTKLTELEKTKDVQTEQDKSIIESQKNKLISEISSLKNKQDEIVSQKDNLKAKLNVLEEKEK